MRVILAAMAFVAAATPAAAQDEAPNDFTGASVSVIGGIDNAKGNGQSATGVAYGITATYDLQVGGAVIGIEGEAADATTKDCENGFLTASDRLCQRAGRDLYVGGRVGFVTGNAMIYAKAGYTNALQRIAYDDGVATANFDFRDNLFLDGVRVGAGVETNINRFVVRAEYRYSNYEQDAERHQGVVGVGFRF